MSEQQVMTASPSTSISIKHEFVLLDLRSYFNNDGISYDPLKCDGDFDGKGATYPAEDLPPSNSLIMVDDIPFYFPSKENGFMNNMVLSSQIINFDPAFIKAMHVLGAVEGQFGEVYEEEVTISCEDGTYEAVYLGLSNWLLPARYNERIAFQCSHLHFPEPGQEVSISNQIPVMSAYDRSSVPSFFSSASSEKKDAENAAKGIWTPRIWLQRVLFDFRKKSTSMAFIDNLNLHIFAITLQKRI